MRSQEEVSFESEQFMIDLSMIFVGFEDVEMVLGGSG